MYNNITSSFFFFFLSLIFLVLQLIDRGKVSVKDVALDIGVSPDSLAATLAVMHTIPNLLH